MAKVIVTFEDKEGEVDIRFKFSPSIKPQDTGTAAQRMALSLHQWLAREVEIEGTLPAEQEVTPRPGPATE